MKMLKLFLLPVTAFAGMWTVSRLSSDWAQTMRVLYPLLLMTLLAAFPGSDSHAHPSVR
jgi:hypothetical protein